jgi:Predicted transcriptional regulator with C-terminal CBS domains
MAAGLTQHDLAKKAGVGLRFVREMEQGKEKLRMDTVNQVLKLFGFELGPVKLDYSQVLEQTSAADEVIRKNGEA